MNVRSIRLEELELKDLRTGRSLRMIPQSLISDSGASALCYAAREKGGPRGVLKEFYPYEAARLSRDAQGRLRSEDGPAFEEAIRHYLAHIRLPLPDRPGIPARYT